MIFEILLPRNMFMIILNEMFVEILRRMNKKYKGKRIKVLGSVLYFTPSFFDIFIFR